MEVTDGEVLEPWRIRGRDTSSHHLRDVTVDVVTEKRRAVLCHLAEASVREEARLHEGLESVADAEDEAAAIDESMNSLRNILVVQDIGNELAASVRLISCRESAAEHEDMTLVDILLHFSDRPEDVVFSQVAEHAHAHFRSGIAPCLR